MTDPRNLARLARAVAAALLLAPTYLSAQWVGATRQAPLTAPHNGAFESSHRDLDRLFNALDYQRAHLFETLLQQPVASSSVLDRVEFGRVTGEVLTRPPSVRIDARTVAPGFVKLAPEIDASLELGRMFRRQVRDVLADSRATQAERDGRMTELVAVYRSQTNLAVSAIPKTMDLLDGVMHSLQYRQRFPMYAGLGWASRWLEAGVYESLMQPVGARAVQQGAMVARFHEMIRDVAGTAPHLLPLTGAIAPEFARRYPEAAAIIDNIYMMEESLADVLVAREIPRSAKRVELLETAAAFRSDTTAAIDVAQWLSGVEKLGIHNMGGSAMAPSASVSPTVSRGASMAGMMGSPMSTAAMPGMDHNATSQTPSSESLMAIHQRMMADPVIRERAATDPVLQRMLNALPSGSSMPGMQHEGMPGMSMTPGAATGLLSGTPAQRALAIEFIVRLLSDPAVEARIHAYPELHTLWSDPEVQRRLAEWKRANPVKE